MIRLITEDDLSQLRQWKNDHREAFFHKDEISEEQQIEWFKEYQNRPNDYMFIVFSAYAPVGCMGIRFVDGVWDIYNVILGAKEYQGRGLMSKGVKEMILLAFLARPIPVMTKVLKDNPAIDWYKKNGFIVTSENFDLRPSDHYVLTYQGET